jgi:hypothetical protein
MAQHDYILANAAGASFRADANNALAAIVSQNSGPNQPNPTFAYQLWADTTTGLLKLRNAANNAWLTIGTLADANLGLLSLAGGTMTGAITFAGTQPTATTAAAGIVQLDSGISSTSETRAATPKAVKDAKDAAAASAAATYLPLAAAGYRNLLINANPITNQRGYVSGTATTVANQYTLDRWRVVTSGQAISWTDSANVRTVTAPAGGVEQVIEGLSVIGGTYALNWTGTATATINGASVAKGGNVTLAGGADATVRFSGGTFSLAQLEPGTVATPFEQRPIGTELALCQRYFQEHQFQTGGVTASGVAMYGQIFYSVQMRSVPTAAFSSVGAVGNFDTAVPAVASVSNVRQISFFKTATGTGSGIYSFVGAFSAEL